MNARIVNIFYPYLFIILFSFFSIANTAYLYAKELADLSICIGQQDAVLVSDPTGHILFSKNEDVPLVPASTLKILTALVALHYLGPEYRFKTEFYMDRDSNLKIKGFGDPLLISEVLLEVVDELSMRIDIDFKKINDLILDDSFFKSPIIIPGITSSYNPYDAPNGALCVNFNSVAFKRNKNGTYVSAEPQTPLLPFVLPRINASSMNEGRIILSSNNSEITMYTGHLFSYFMKKKGVAPNGNIKIGTVQKEKDRLVFRYFSKFTLEQVVAKLLEHSNNFIANQLLIVAGAEMYGPPGTLEKGVLAARSYAHNTLKVDHFQMFEGSGISIKNRMSAKNLSKILKAFLPFHSLMPRNGRQLYKTGTLHGVHTRAGYIEDAKGALYSFVILINTPGKSPEPIMDIILKAIE
ncbi:MAG: D-alanyl-D-alanine carboxypeptidase [Deltaproteobacteria bacterium]|nr:D-alanyl-D-alanine carboxypeptidase [Deltaproteobacteria bacterium]